MTALVIDDEPAILRFIQLALDDTVDVITAPDGETAATMLDSQQPDIIITDLRLPGMDGTQLAKMVKANPKTSAMPVLLISAFGEPPNHRADAFLAKPFDIDLLTDLVGKLLSQNADSGASSPNTL